MIPTDPGWPLISVGIFAIVVLVFAYMVHNEIPQSTQVKRHVRQAARDRKKNQRRSEQHWKALLKKGRRR